MASAPSRPTLPPWAALQRFGAPLLSLSRRELRARYAGTRLGGLWALLQPMATIAIYLTVFVAVMQAGRDVGDARQYALFIVAGLLPFQALGDGLQRACTSLREEKALLESAIFPAATIPLARVVSAAVPELMGLLLLAMACAIWGGGGGLALAALPLLWLGRMGLTAGLALWVSVISVFVSDVTELLGFVLVALLFLTPIFYTASQAPAALQAMAWLNPLQPVVDAYRDVLLHNRWPWQPGLSLLAWAVLALASGIWVFNRALAAMRDEL